MTDKSRLLIIFALVYFFSPNGLSSLADLPVNFFLKDVIKLTAAQLSYFGAVSILGWALKPFWGAISDTKPLFGSRRRNYLIFVSLIASGCWLALAAFGAVNVWVLLGLLTLSSLAYAFQDVVTDALMIELGNQEQALDQFQGIQWLGVNIAKVITGLAGGYAAAKLAAQTTFAITALFPLIVALLALVLLRGKETTGGQSSASDFRSQVTNALRSPHFLLAAVFMFLWRFSPSIGAPFFFYGVDVLKFSPLFIGAVASIGALGAAVGSIAFPLISKRLSFRKFLTGSVLIGGLASFFPLVFLLPAVKASSALAQFIAITTAPPLAVLDMVVFLAILGFAARQAELGAAGTLFAFLMAVMNLGLMGSQAIGGFLFDKIGLAPLIVVSALTSLLVLAFIPFLKTES